MIPLARKTLIHLLIVLFMALPANAADLTADAAGSNNDVILLIVYVLLALVFSFLCSIAEAVLLSITPAFIAGMQEKKPALAALLKRLKQDNVDRSLAAILTLNTIAHTVGAIGSGAKATAVFGSAWFGLFSAVMTLLILFLSEIIPKTIGAVYWRSLAGLTARFVNTLVWALFPLIWVSEALTRLVAGKGHSQLFCRDEFIAMVGVGERAGEIEPGESRIFRNLFRLGSLTAEDVMTPRTVISGLPAQMSVADASAALPGLPFSRLPLYDKDMDHISGFVLRNDLLLANIDGRCQDPISSLQRKMETVTHNMSLSELLAFFLDRRQHIALVVDEYGTKGLVTMEDAVETLLGMEIVDEMDRVEDMQVLARKQWKRRVQALGVTVGDKE